MSRNWSVIEGDCALEMAKLPRGSVDAVICDPPYSLAFMDSKWDSWRTPQEFQAWTEAWAREALRVLRPGGHLLAFGAPRTYHRLAAGIEDAGFEVRDAICWLQGKGMPKSRDVTKDLDRLAGIDGEWGEYKSDRHGQMHTKGTVRNGAHEGWERPWHDDEDAVRRYASEYIPASTLGRQYKGFGTGLKPGAEFIVMARKPVDGTVAANIMRHGTGALNIDATRIAVQDGDPADTEEAKGRWPANVVLDEEAAESLDHETGELGRSQGGNIGKSDGFVYNGGWSGRVPGDPGYGDTGGASRYFYVTKAITAEREAGLHGEGKRNLHPCVKPIDLMRWLAKLVTPPGGMILDPFAGSGSTGCASVVEGFRFIGIEKDERYVLIAAQRIAFWAKQPRGMDTRKVIAAAAARGEVQAAGQLELM